MPDIDLFYPLERFLCRVFRDKQRPVRLADQPEGVVLLDPHLLYPVFGQGDNKR